MLVLTKQSLTLAVDSSFLDTKTTQILSHTEGRAICIALSRTDVLGRCSKQGTCCTTVGTSAYHFRVCASKWLPAKKACCVRVICQNSTDIGCGHRRVPA